MRLHKHPRPWRALIGIGLAASFLLAPDAPAQNFDDLLDTLSADKPYALKLELTSDYYFRGLDQIERDDREPGYQISGIVGLPLEVLFENAPLDLRVFAGFEVNRVDIANTVPPGFTNAGATRNGASFFIPMFTGISGVTPLSERFRWTILGGYLWMPDSRVPTVTGGQPIFGGCTGAGAPPACAPAMGSFPILVGFQPTLGEGNTTFSFWEVGVSFSYDFDYGRARYLFLTGPNVLGLGGRSYYNAADLTLRLPNPLPERRLNFQLELHGAHQAITRNAAIGVPDFFEWSVGLRAMLVTSRTGRFYVRFRYSDTDIPANRCQFNPFTGSGSGICGAAFIASAGWIF